MWIDLVIVPQLVHSIHPRINIRFRRQNILIGALHHLGPMMIRQKRRLWFRPGRRILTDIVIRPRSTIHIHTIVALLVSARVGRLRRRSRARCYITPVLTVATYVVLVVTARVPVRIATLQLSSGGRTRSAAALIAIILAIPNGEKDGGIE